jgi:hypothetical protein
MKAISTYLLIFVFSFTFWVHAEGTSDNYSLLEERSDSIKVIVKQKESKKLADTEGTTNIPENKTNWSKIKDLFM